MDGNNWRPATQGESSGIDNDWRNQLTSDARKKIVNKIIETLRKHLPVAGPEGSVELQKIAVRFEEKIYTAATSQADYLRKISMKMLSMENKPQPGPPNTLPPNVNPNPSDQGNNLQATPAMQAQRNPGQPLLMPLTNQSQSRQQLVNPSSTTTQSSAGLPSSLSSVSGLTQNAMSTVSQGSNMQVMPGMSQNSMTSSIGQGAQSQMFANSQRQMPGRPQQQSQNSQQLIYQQQQQQLHHQLSKQKVQQGNIQANLLPPHMQQQQLPLLQPNHISSSQQSLIQMPTSNLSSSQTSQQTQLSMMQSSQSSIQQNQQSGPSVLQQQSALRQQQQVSVAQQPVLPSQQQQQLTGQQSNSANMQQNQLLGQQNSVSDISHQQQRLLGQQNNLSNTQHQQQSSLGQQNSISSLQQQQLGSQNSISGLQQQQQQLLGPQNSVSGLQQPQQQQLLGSGLSNIQQHQHTLQMMQHSKVPAPQQQAQQTSSALLPSQGQQSQSQPPQPQLMSQIPTQQQQLPQQLQLQQQPNSLKREMQQRMQTTGTLLPPQNSIDQQKQLFQPQRVHPDCPSSSVDSTAQTGHTGVGDWQEEVYQKIKSMKELYFPELSEMFHRINLKFQQHDALVQHPKQSEHLEKLRFFKIMLERMIAFLQITKNNISLPLKDRLASYEKQIQNILNSNRMKKPVMPPQQVQQSLAGGQSHLVTQQSQSQMAQMQQHDNHLNQMQSNLQPSMSSIQPPAVTGMPHASVPLSAHLGVPTTQHSMMNTLQPSSNMDSTAGNMMSSMIGSLQHNTMSLQQNTMNTSQQTNVNTLSQSGSGALPPNINHLQQNPNMIHHPHLKQEQLMQTQQLKQYQQRQFIQQQQQKQQQFQQQQQKPLQSVQLQQHQMPQLHQMNETNELKVRPGTGVKNMTFPQHHPSGQRPTYQQQQQQLKMNSMNSMPIPSPQFFQAHSPQISQHSSPQIDQQSLLNSVPKSGTPLQSASSPFVPPSPSTPLAPSPLPGDTEKQQPSGISSILSAGNVGHQQITVGLTHSQSLAIGTPGISASPLLAEFSTPDGNQAGASTKSNATERPLERLIKVVKSMSPSALSYSVSDIGSVVSMVDRIAGSAPGNGSRTAVGEDLVALTKCRLQARNFLSQDGSAATKKMKRHTSAMPLNVVSSAGSANDCFKQLDSLDTSELESTATSKIQRHRFEVNQALLEEIRDINQRLIDTVVEICDEDVDSVAAESEGTIVKCSYNAVALTPNLKSQNASVQMSPILPLRLLIPAIYPNCSPILMDKLPVELSKEFEDLSLKARLKFSISLRCLSQPMSLGEMARTWDFCARNVVTEYAQQNGGGSFSSRYGTWEKCVSA